MVDIRFNVSKEEKEAFLKIADDLGMTSREIVLDALGINFQKRLLGRRSKSMDEATETLVDMRAAHLDNNGSGQV